MTLEGVRALAAARPARDRWAALMYHELAVAGRPLAGSEPGYAGYCVERDTFRAQMAALAGAGLRGTSLGEARARGDAGNVALTFDDGCETDRLEAAPILLERGFRATFFVVADFLGRRGYLTAAQLGELSSAGFEIGSHSLSHCMLTTLGPRELDHELAGSRARLEDAAGAPVTHFSCPHGRWSQAVAEAARRAGYDTVSTSQAGLNSARTPGTRLRRIAVQRGLGAGAVAGLARGHGLWRIIARNAALDVGKRVLGEEGYAACRRRMIGFLGRE